MDETYIHKVLNGDYQAFSYFIDTYKGYAFSLAFSILKNEFLAEDSVQESFVSAYKGLKKFKENSGFKTWFSRIVINNALRKADKEKKQSEFISDAAVKPDIFSVSEAVNGILDEERKFYISKAFELMPPLESLALELFYLKEMEVKEICEMTNWSASKTKMLLLRGRKRFYTLLEKILKTELKEIV